MDQTSLRIVELLEEFGPAYRSYVGEQLPEGQSLPRLRVMAELAECESLTMTELRNRVGGSAQNLTKLIDGLEKEEAVVRLPHPDDRRATLVVLTGPTREWVKRARQEHRERVARLFDSLTAAQRKHFAAALETLNRAVSGATATCGTGGRGSG